jgi:hypothetical protein
MSESESKSRANSRCRLGGAGKWGASGALALVAASILCLAPLPASLAKPLPPFPERDVTIEFVRVIPPGGTYEPGAVPLGQLEPVVQAALRTLLANPVYPEADLNEADPTVNLYKVVKIKTIHLGDPQLVHISPGQQFEFRRVGIGGGSVECATVEDGVVTMWSSRYWKELSKDPFLCSMSRWNSDVYVVAWMSKTTPAAGH